MYIPENQSFFLTSFHISSCPAPQGAVECRKRSTVSRLKFKNVFLFLRWPRNRKTFLNLSRLTVLRLRHSTAPWGAGHEEMWKLVKKNDWFSGMYIWTGWAHISTLELEAR